VGERLGLGRYIENPLHLSDVRDETDDLDGASGKDVQLRWASCFFQQAVSQVG